MTVSENTNPNLIVTTINFPKFLLEISDKLADEGYISSRSELIRCCALLGLPIYLEARGLLKTINIWLEKKSPEKSFEIDESKIRVLTNPNGRLERCGK